MSNNLSNYGSSYSALAFFFSLYILFLPKGNVLKITAKFCVPFFLLHIIVAHVIVCLYSLFTMLSGNFDITPVPLSNFKEYFSICHWNLNSISTRSYSKLLVLTAYIMLYKFEIICLSETYLDSINPNNDDKLQILGRTLIGSDHPSNTQRGRVCIYYESFLPLKVINIGYLHECLSFELQTGNKICNFVALFRSPTQSQDNFETFADSFEMTLELLAQKNPFLLTAVGDFNAISSNWYNKYKLSFEGNTIKNITSQLGLNQIINEPMHILPNSSSLDLIFNQIVFAKFNLEICYPPPYSRIFWHSKDAKTDLIRRALNDLNQERAF